MAQRVIIDTDPGIDDALAILLALRSPELGIIGTYRIIGTSVLYIYLHNSCDLIQRGHAP